MSVRALKVAAGAGDPDDALALRIDVVKAAEDLADSWIDTSSEWDLVIARAENNLAVAVMRYRNACKARR